MYNQKLILISLALLISGTFLFNCGCTSYNVEDDSASSDKKGNLNQISTVTAEGNNYFEALNTAITKAVRQAIIGMIGYDTFNANKETIENVFLDVKWRKARRYIINYDRRSKNTKGNMISVTLVVTLNLDKISSELKKLNINVVRTKPQKTGSESINPPPVDDNIDNLRDVLQHETFMVYFDKRNLNIKPALARLAVQEANSFLSQKSLEYVNEQRVVQLLRGQVPTQDKLLKIAKRTKADVYLQIDGKVVLEPTRYGWAFATGGVNVTAYESSTGRGLGSFSIYHRYAGKTNDIAEKAVITKTVKDALIKTLNLVYKTKRRAEIFKVVIRKGKMPSITNNIHSIIKNSFDRINGVIHTKVVVRSQDKAVLDVKFQGGTVEDFIDNMFRKFETTEYLDVLQVSKIERKSLELFFEQQ